MSCAPFAGFATVVAHAAALAARAAAARTGRLSRA